MRIIRAIACAFLTIGIAIAVASLRLSAQVPALVPGVTIVLPPRLLANSPATLAVLGTDGHLVPNTTVQISNGQYVTTDATGRALFTAPANGAFIAQVAGASAAALVDAAPPPTTAAHPSVAPAVSVRDRFPICGSGFLGQATANHVKINGDAAFILAASPECLVVLPQSRTLYGTAKIEIQSADVHTSATTALVALDFFPPKPPLVPGKESALTVRADGTDAPLRVIVENRSPGILRFIGGDTQERRTSGGNPNYATVTVKAIRSGDFSFYAHILPTRDPASAARYLNLAAAVAVAPKRRQSALKKLAAQVAREPDNSAKALRELDSIASTTLPGPLRTLLDAARSCLQ